MVGSKIYGIWRLGRVVADAGIRTMHSTSRRASTFAQSKIVQGPNGERIIQSPHGEVPSFSGMLIHEYVWDKSEDYADKIALVISIMRQMYYNKQHIHTKRFHSILHTLGMQMR